MSAISVTFTAKVATDWDPQKPLTTTKMNGLVDNTTHLREWLGSSYTAGAVQDHNHDGSNSAAISAGPNYLRNPSFETDTSGWTLTTYTGGTVARVTATNLDGLASLAVTSTVLANGGGDAVSNEFVPIAEGFSYGLRFAIKGSVVNVSSKVEIQWFDNTHAAISSSTIYSSSATPTSLTLAGATALAPANSRFMKVKLTGGVPATGSATGTIYFDGLILSGANGITQTVGDNSTKLATTAYCENFVNNDIGASQAVGGELLAFTTSGAVAAGAIAVVGLYECQITNTPTILAYTGVNLSGSWRNISLFTASINTAAMFQRIS